MFSSKLPEKCIRTVGACIYCGAKAELTDEHIVPVAMGGHAYLKDASCGACQEVTSRIEGRVLREGGPLYPLRRALSIHSRRKKFDLYSTTSWTAAVARHVCVPFDQAPVVVPIRRFNARPGIVLSKAVDDEYGPPHWSLATAPDHYGRLHKLGVSAISHNLTIAPDYERMILKIAYCAAVGRFGLDALEPIAIGVMLGQETGIPFLLGEATSEDYDDCCERSSLAYAQHAYDDGTYLLVVLYRPFRGGISPVYEAAVAKMTKPIAEVEQRSW